MTAFGRAILFAFAGWATVLVATGSGAAQAAPYAAIVMDMRTGQVVHADGADRVQHPASLTKLMTLYLTFEAIETGQIGLDQKVRISSKAASQPPSKLGMRPGQRVTIRHLIRAAAIRSANDAAMALAEAVGGSQAEFARMMTAKARALGMRNTTFKNPHGLTESGHLSTARDMATLARHIAYDFPQYYNVFGRTRAYAAGKHVHTTNRLLMSYSGADGLKTGYTRAAGYNLAATATRGDRRVLVVVMGGSSSRWRNRRVAELLDRGFRETPRYAAVVKPRLAAVKVAEAPMPPSRPGVPPTGLAAIASAVASEAQAAQPIDPTLPRSEHAPLYGAAPLRRPGAGSAPVGAAVGAAPAPVLAPATGDWAVQLGAFFDEASAVASLKRVELADLPMLATAESVIAAERTSKGRPIYKVRYRGLDEGRARAACAVIEEKGGDCLEMAPR